MKISLNIIFLITWFSLFSFSISSANSKTHCDCHIKDEKTVCVVEIVDGNDKVCACEKETMYGKRKWKDLACSDKGNSEEGITE